MRTSRKVFGLLTAVVLVAPETTLLHTMVPAQAAALAVDAQVVTHQANASSSVASPAFSTSQANELILAFVSADGPASGAQSVGAVSGGGLTWTLRSRQNGQAGTAEIWQAVAAAKLTSVAVTASLAGGGFVSSLAIVSFSGANTSVAGAVGGANAATGPPSTAVTTTQNGSWVWAVGNDWDGAAGRTVGPNQTLVDQYLASVGDTFWVQRLANTTPTAGTSTQSNDTAPTNHRWNLAAIEILPATQVAPDTTPPTSPTGLTAALAGSNTVNLSWTASSDNVGVATYDVYRSTTSGFVPGAANRIARPGATTFVDSGLAPGTYYYVAQAEDASGNISPPSNQASVTIPPDNTPPSTPTLSSAAATDTSHVSLSWTPATDNAGGAGLAGYRISRTTGTTTVTLSSPGTATTYTDGSVSPNTSYQYSVAAYDAALPANYGSSSNTLSVTTPAVVVNATIFPPTASPATLSNSSLFGIEVGVKFQADVAGTIAGIRFYKGSTNTGTHSGSLWTASGSLLSSATFKSESASGWQQVTFATPVPIAAKTTYVASYYSPGGRYSSNTNYFINSTDRPPLHALASGASGGNGVSRSGVSSGFPTSSSGSTNYWVDVVFNGTAPPPPDTTPPSTPAGVTATAVSSSQVNLSWTAATDNVGVTGYKVMRNGTQIGASSTTGFSDGTVVPSTTYTYTVAAFDSAGNTSPASNALTVTTPAASQLLFDDEFDGSAVDLSRWTVVNVHADASNGEEPCYMPANTTVAGGSLVETLRVEAATCPTSGSDGGTAGAAHTSGAVQMKSFSFTYGTVEARIKFSGGRGSWPAFWMLGANCQSPQWLPDPSSCQWPSTGSDEIDIAEILDQGHGTVTQSVHSNGSNPGCSASASDVSANWHTYTLVWSPGRLVFKIDGTTTCTLTTAVPSTPMFVILDTSAGGAAGSIDDATLPQSTQVDYVRVTQ